MTFNASDWRPSASLPTLKLRARFLAKIRAFFHVRGVWEVETPALCTAAVSDPHIASFAVHGAAAETEPCGYLHTSPEFHMKRLLVAGSDSIYQIAKVFRQGEAGRKHNPEFTMIEWYRTGFDHFMLMDEVEALVHELLGEFLALGERVQRSYREVFQEYAGIDPYVATCAELRRAAIDEDIDGIELGGDRDAWLDLLMTHVVESRLPRDCPVFIYDYPASQAALAKIREEDYPVAERFELYLNGMELANGFHELTDVTEQRRRFEKERAIRQAQGLPLAPIDERFLASLQQGLPDCAGVAVGFDRLVMLAAGVNSIAEVLAFDISRA